MLCGFQHRPADGIAAQCHQNRQEFSAICGQLHFFLAAIGTTGTQIPPNTAKCHFFRHCSIITGFSWGDACR